MLAEVDREARKALKKTQKEEISGAEEIVKKKKKRERAEEENEAGESSGKVKKRGDDSEAPAKKQKRHDASAEKDDGIHIRPRTRSLSNADEVFPEGMSAETFRLQHQISIKGNADNGSGTYLPPSPLLSFSATPFAAPIKRALESAGFSNPTPTQAQAWPIALSGRDVITVAKTGSGKTCGFLLPAFHRLEAQLANRRRGPPGILVLAPTRELACQIEEECVKFGRSSNMRSTCAYGGAPKSMQIRKIQAGLEVLIATPGRLNDLLEMGIVKLDLVTFLVLDEADRMLDMGFEPQIRQILSKLPADRQNMMFSATWPREIQALAREFLNNPVEIKFGDTDSLNANKDISQIIKVISEGEKADTLNLVLKEINPGGKPEEVPKVIIFVSRKYSCDDLANKLWNEGYAVDSLHGDREQFQRTKVMEQFKRGQLRVLVATDVAARGLDVKDVKVVINYDFPGGTNGVEDYVHRIGRTARGGEKGQAYTFFTAGDAKRASQLIGVLRRSGQDVPDALSRFDRGSGGRFGGRGGGGRGWGGGRGGRGGGGGFRGGRFGGGGGRSDGFGGGGRKW